MTVRHELDFGELSRGKSECIPGQCENDAHIKKKKSTNENIHFLLKSPNLKSLPHVYYSEADSRQRGIPAQRFSVMAVSRHVSITQGSEEAAQAELL